MAHGEVVTRPLLAALVAEVQGRPLEAHAPACDVYVAIDQGACNCGGRVLLTEAERDALCAAVPTWRPMESAPKDGRLIMLHWPYWCSRPAVGKWFPHNSPTGYWDCLEVPCQDVDGAGGPLAWMPLPDPPAEREP